MLSWSHKHHYPMCHAVAAAAPAVHCNGIQPYKGAALEEGRLLLLSSGGVINYLALWTMHIQKVKVVLYSAVSSPLDRSMRFTRLALPCRPVHSDTNSASPGSILACSNYAQRLNHLHVHHCLYPGTHLYSWVNWGVNGENENAQSSKL